MTPSGAAPTNRSGEKLRAVVLAVILCLSSITIVTVTGGAAAANTAGTVTVSAPTAGNQATVTVDDADLNTDSGSAQDHIVNVEATRESPALNKQTSSDTPDGGTQTVTISPAAKVGDRNNDGTIDKNDFTLFAVSDESITDVSKSNGDYVVTISDSGSTTSDSNTETVQYDELVKQQSLSDTDNGSPQTFTVGPVGDRNGDGDITAADFKLVTSSDDESITNVARNSDGTVDVTITDSSDDGDSGNEALRYLHVETVKLTETGADTGTFEGTIPIHTNSVVTNGELYVTHTDTIIANYWDSSASTKRTTSTTYKIVAASASASKTEPAAGESITLDGTGSAGSVATYEWDVDGDNSYEKTGSSVSKSYANAGAYTVTLKVSDGNGHTDTDTVTVVVGDSGPPTAKLDVYPRFVTKDETAYLVAQQSSDDLQNGIEKYEFDVDDDDVYEKSSTQNPVAQHTFSSNGDHNVTVRVTDYAGNTDTFTKTVTVQGQASVTNTNVTHTGNGTAPSGTLNVATRNEGGMLKLHLYRGESTSNRDLGAAGVDESTEVWVNVTIENYEPNAMMASAKIDEWTTSPNSAGAGTNISIKLHPINMQRLSNPGSKSPGRWPSQHKQADLSITPGAHLATFDMPDGTEFEADFDGATLTSDAQQFSPPRYNSQTKQLSYSVAAPHWKASGKKVDSNTNSGFYEAWIPSGLVDEMGIQNPDDLAAKYTSGGSTSSLTNVQVEQMDSGGLHINITGLHYSSGTVKLEPDSTAPTANAGSNKSVSAGTSFSFDGTGSSDNRQISTYEWDTNNDGDYTDESDRTGAQPTHSYSSTGDHTVTLRVTDGNGNTDTDTVTVSVTSSSGNSGGSSDGSDDESTTATPTATDESTEVDEPIEPTDTDEPIETADTDEPIEPTDTANPTETDDRTEDAQPSEPTSEPRATSGSGPGFGVVASLLALFATALLSRRP